MSESVASLGSLGTSWVDSLTAISKSDWYSCFPKYEPLKSYNLQKAIECSNLVGITFEYLVIKSKQAGTVVAIVPCFYYRVSLTDVAPAFVQRFVNNIRKVYPSFLFVNMFVAGSPIAICSDLIGINPDIVTPGPSKDALLKMVYRTIDERLLSGKSSIAVIKEIKQRYKRDLLSVIPSYYSVNESPASSYVYVGPLAGNDYLSHFRNRYRSSIKSYLNRFKKAGLRWELREDFSDYTREMHRLYLNVLNNSNVRFECLTHDFFNCVNREMGNKSSALLCFAGDKLVAMELLLQGKEMHPIYLGMDYEYLTSASLYFNCLIQLLKEAESRGCYLVELGQTSYQVKSNFGAKMEPLYFAIRHRNWLLNRLLRLFASKLFPVTPLIEGRNIFKHQRLYNETISNLMHD